MTSEQELLQKADLVLANLNAGGGILSPQQSDRFIKRIVDQPTLVKLVRTVPMNAPVQEINRIGIGSRILRPATENVGLVASDRSKPDFTKLQLETKEVIAEIRIPYMVLEDNIEGDNLQDTILALVAERAAYDLEELLILGDTASADPYLALQDGLLKRIVSNTSDSIDMGYGSTPYNAAIKAMPYKYRRNKGALRFLINPDSEQEWRETIAGRQTALGDATIQGDSPGRVHGIRLEPITMFAAGTGVLTDPNNIILGIRRNFRLESEKLISERQYKFVLTARVGIGLEEEEATVEMTNVGVETPP